MAIRIVTVEPIAVHAVVAVNKTPGRPKVHSDRAAYRRDWMRRARAEDRADAVRLAQID
jgi:hypothetical protein